MNWKQMNLNLKGFNVKKKCNTDTVVIRVIKCKKLIYMWAYLRKENAWHFHEKFFKHK